VGREGQKSEVLSVSVLSPEPPDVARNLSVAEAAVDLALDYERHRWRDQ
jgi:hypothetical protein